MRRNHNGSHSEHHLVIPPTVREVTEDILSRLLQTGNGYRTAVVICVILVVLGIVGFIMRFQGGLQSNRAQWGYQTALLSFLLTTAQSAPIVAIGLRLIKAHWRRQLTRATELLTVVGIINLLLYIPLILILPPLEGRKSLWMGWPGAPGVWDTIAMIMLVATGLALLYVSAIPDLATARNRGSSSGRGGLFRSLSLGWQGTKRQWRILQGTLGFLGAFYFMLVIFLQLIISVDFGESLVPGWKDAIFPSFQALASLQAGVATTIVVLFILRKTAKLERYIYLDHFWGLSKLLLALSLLWFYFWWAGFITYWYGRTPAEQNVLRLIMFGLGQEQANGLPAILFGPYFIAFLIAFFCCFVLSLGILMWNPVRKSIVGPTLVASLVLIGTFFNQIRLYVSAFSIENAKAEALEILPATHFPDFADILITVGVFAAAVLLYLVASKIVPLVSIWETKEGSELETQVTVGQARVRVVGKPE